jgi:parallel beta-helix repeat protein
MTHYVGGSGPGNYTTIWSAVQIADPGDTVYVHSGWYGDQFEVTKPLTIVGEDRDTTVIRGDGLFPTIRISSDWVNISGFTVTKRATNPGSTAFELTLADHCNISDNNILENEFGFYLFFANETTMTGNVMQGGERGILSLHSNSLMIGNNNIWSNEIGMMLFDSGNSTIQNNDLRFNTNHGIYFSYNHGNTIEGNNIWSNGDDDISFNSSGDDGIHLYISNNNIVRNNQISENSKSGISLYSSVYNKISDNDISSNMIRGIHLEDSDHNEIMFNAVSSNERIGIHLDSSNENFLIDNTITSSDEGLSLGDSHRNTVSKNSFLESSTYGFSAYDSEDNIIEDNLASDNYHGFHLFGSDNTYIANNSISNCDFGIYMHTTSDTRVLDNQIDLTTVGVYLTSTMNTNASGNVMIGNGIVVEGGERESWQSLMIDSTNTVNGKPVYFVKNENSVHVPSGYGQIIITAGSGIYVENSEISDTSSAIQVGHASNVFVLNNTISSNGWNGVRFESVRHGYVNDNILVDNGKLGISVWLSDDVKISRNYIADHSLYGVKMMMGERNFIFHNSFIGNGFQGYNEGENNQWDSGYPSGGNYWSNYIHDDTLRGEHQDQPGSDGIGDEPRPLEGTSGKDRYPLVSPLVVPPPIFGNLQPGCQVDSPSDDSEVSGDVTVDGTASDPDGTIVMVEVRIGDSPWLEAEGTTSWTFEWDSTKNSNGEIDIRVRSFDGESYSEEVIRTLTVNNIEGLDATQIFLWILLAVMTTITVYFVIQYIIRYREYTKQKKPPEEPDDVELEK